MTDEIKHATRRHVDEPRLYHEFASWWPLMSPPKDYAREADLFYDLFSRGSGPGPATVLELGSGGGHTASHLKRRSTLTLVDRSPEMLAVSQALNPECEHVEGDMRTVRLQRTFDAVLVHDAIVYAIDEIDLRQVLATAFEHCRPGGAAIFAPDFVTETFRANTQYGGEDGADRSMRYVEWTTDPDPLDTTYQVDFVYLFREGTGPIKVEQDVHVLGVFPRRDWHRLLDEVGFDPEIVSGGNVELDTLGMEVFLGRKNPHA